MGQVTDLAGPWQKYQTAPAAAPAGPWTKYGGAKPLAETPPPAGDSRGLMPRVWTAPQGQNERPGFVGQVATDMQGIVDNLLAGMQGTTPVAKDLYGVDTSKKLGTFEADIDGDPNAAGYFKDRAFYAYDPSKHVLRRDPESGRLSVYERTAETDETIGALGRIIGMGAQSTAPVRLAAGAAKTLAGKAEPAIQAFKRANVPPTWAAVGGRGTRKVYNWARDFFPTAGTLEKADTRSLKATGQRLSEQAGKYGTVETPERAGAGLIKGAEAFKTGFKAKAAGLFGAVDRAIPERTQVPMRSTVTIIKDIAQQFHDPVLAKKFLDSNVKDLFEAIGRGAGHLTWKDARRFRMEVGKMLKKPVIMADIDRAQVQRLYGSLSEDLGVSAETMGAGPLWTRANSFYAAGQKRIQGALKELLTPGATPESAFALLSKSAAAPRVGASRGNLAKLMAIKRSMPADEWGDAVATTLEQMGKPTAGAASGSMEGAAGYSPSTFLTRYDDLSSDAKDLMFNQAGKPALRSALDDLVKIATSQKAMKLASNTSGTAGIASVTAIGAGLAVEPITTIASVLGAAGMAKAFSSAPFVRWMAGVSRAGPAKFPAAVARLSQMARIDPALREFAQALERALLPAAAAGSDSDPLQSTAPQ